MLHRTLLAGDPGRIFANFTEACTLQESATQNKRCAFDKFCVLNHIWVTLKRVRLFDLEVRPGVLLQRRYSILDPRRKLPRFRSEGAAKFNQVLHFVGPLS